MSFEDLFARVIDRDAMVRSLERWINGEEERMQTFECAALVHLECGHVRPMNIWFEPGDELACFVCGPSRVAELELIEPQEFPHPDALGELPEAA